MKRFRFRLARLLALRERIFDRRRLELEAARESVQRTERAIDTARSSRRQALETLAGSGVRLAATARRDLLLYAEHLGDQLALLTDRLASERRAEAAALAALQQAARDRKVLIHLRDRRSEEHRREIDREEQKTNDEFAARRRAFAATRGPGAGAAAAPAPGTLFREEGNALPPDGLIQELIEPA